MRIGPYDPLSSISPRLIETKHATWPVHDAAASAHSDARRLPRGNHGEGAARRAARLRRAVGGRAFLGDQRADPLAVDAHGKPRAADETDNVRDRRHQS